MKKLYGINLIELMIVIGIVSILLLAGSGLFHETVNKTKIETRVDELATIVQTARTIAISQGKTMMLKPLRQNDWSSTIQLLELSNQHAIKDNLTLHHQWQWNDKNIQVYWKGFTAKNYILFHPQLNKNAANGYFTVSANNMSEKLILNRLGRPRTEHIE
jgi:Tfp pilus assembly protein FimT